MKKRVIIISSSILIIAICCFMLLITNPPMFCAQMLLESPLGEVISYSWDISKGNDNVKAHIYKKDGKLILRVSGKGEMKSFTTDEGGVPWDNIRIDGVVVEKGVENLGSLLVEDWYFSDKGGRHIESLSLPSTIKKIDVCAVNTCPYLSTIKYAGTIKQWRSIEIDENWCQNCGKITIKFTGMSLVVIIPACV